MISQMMKALFRKRVRIRPVLLDVDALNLWTLWGNYSRMTWRGVETDA